MMRRDMFIQSMIEWIDKNIEKNLCIKDIAKKSGYSSWHLQRVFHEETAETIAHYVRHRRLEKAALQLINSSEKIETIAISCGFHTQQTFTRAFSKKFHVSPAKWREQKKNRQEQTHTKS